MHPVEFVVRQLNLENEMNTISEQEKQEQVKIMTRLACSDARRLPIIRAPADRAAQERQTTTNVPITFQHLRTVSNKEIHHHGFSIDCQTNHQSFHNQKQQGASDRNQTKKHASGKRGSCRDPPFPHHCAEAVANIRLSRLRLEEWLDRSLRSRRLRSRRLRSRRVED